MSLAAVVLAGGTSRRLGGQDKTRLVLGGLSLLDRVLAALPAVAEVVVVGPERPVPRPVRFVREQPPGGGPLAALAAGVRVITAEQTMLLAADLPFLTPAALGALVEAARGQDGAVAIDGAGRDQLMLSAWSTQSLREALPPDPHNAPLRRVLDRLDAARVSLPGDPPPWWDCDTPQAWEQALRWAGPNRTAPLP